MEKYFSNSNFGKGSWLKFFWLVCLFFAAASLSHAQQVSGSNKDKLLEKYQLLREQLSKNPYQRPLFIESSEGSSMVSSTAYAVLDSPFTTVSSAFRKPGQWCEVLILHINTKFCRAEAKGAESMLAVRVGKKTPQSLSDAFPLNFSFQVATASSDNLEVRLHSDSGPLSTTDYQLLLQAIPLVAGKTFIKLHYSYGYGLAGRLAMQTYLATVGRGKVGFSKTSDGARDAYVGGMRGTVERNTMRYFLAMEAYLASIQRPVEGQLQARLAYWFDATEQYSHQLHELDWAQYLTMKKAEHARQDATVQNIP